MSFIKRFFDVLLAGFCWYRKITKGKWYLISPNLIPELNVWVRRPNQQHETILKKESWKRGYCGNRN